MPLGTSGRRTSYALRPSKEDTTESRDSPQVPLEILGHMLRPHALIALKASGFDKADAPRANTQAVPGLTGANLATSRG